MSQIVDIKMRGRIEMHHLEKIKKRKSFTKHPKKKNENLRSQLEMYELIFNSIYNGAMVTDADGYITHFNKPYGQFLGLNPEEQIGKYCLDAIENSRMHIVAKTGRPEINQSHYIMGQNMVVQRIPIKKDGKIIAVFGQVMFKDVRDVRKLAQKLSLLESKVKLYEQELMNLRSTRYTLDSIIGKSKAMVSLKKEALNAATTRYPVLLTGESGTGKELFAQAIHHASPRKLHPFVRINCSAIPKDLIESELFGYEKGAFTGARSSGKPGKFELAHNGTVFLDEIGDLPLEMQPKLLRVLEEKEFERIGGTSFIRSNFRLIAATNQNLENMLAEGRFRKDLFYRLNVISLHIPPLRKRKVDVGVLSRYLLKQLTEEANLPEIDVDSEAEQVLKNYEWPGNVRELSNVLERTLSSFNGRTIRTLDLPFYLHRSSKKTDNHHYGTIKEAVVRAEIDAIRQALVETGYNKARAANMLGIHRTLLYKKISRYNISLNADM
jgi:PAS domain S-box-containing protein